MKPAPARIPHHDEKLVYLQRRQYGACPIALSHDSVHRWACELHHAGVANSKINRARYPLYVHSVWNLVAVNHDAHMVNGSFGRISLLEADQREAFLRRHPGIAGWMNSLNGSLRRPH